MYDFDYYAQSIKDECDCSAEGCDTNKGCDLTRYLQAKAEIWKAEKKRELAEEHTARILLQAGVILIPSDHLRDNEFVVSHAVYEAAKRIAEYER